MSNNLVISRRIKNHIRELLKVTDGNKVSAKNLLAYYQASNRQLTDMLHWMIDGHKTMSMTEMMDLMITSFEGYYTYAKLYDALLAASKGMVLGEDILNIVNENDINYDNEEIIKLTKEVEDLKDLIEKKDLELSLFNSTDRVKLEIILEANKRMTDKIKELTVEVNSLTEIKKEETKKEKMFNKAKRTDVTDEIVLSMYLKGKTAYDIAKIFDMTQQGVRARLIKLNAWKGKR